MRQLHVSVASDIRLVRPIASPTDRGEYTWVSAIDAYFTFDASLNGICRVVVSLSSTKTFRDGHTRVSPGLKRAVGLEF